MEKAEQTIAAGRPPTKADLDRALVELFDRLLEECEEWLAVRPPFLHERTYSSEEEFMADLDRAFDDHRNPDSRREEWQFCLQNGVYRQAADRLAIVLADMGVTMDLNSVEFKMLASRGMRIGIEAFSRFSRSLNGERLDDDLMALIDRRQEPSPSAAAVGQPPTEVAQGSLTPAAKTIAPTLSSFK